MRVRLSLFVSFFNITIFSQSGVKNNKSGFFPPSLIKGHWLVSCQRSFGYSDSPVNMTWQAMNSEMFRAKYPPRFVFLPPTFCCAEQKA